MTNNRDKIDDLFREGLDGYRVEPSQGLWGKIEARFFTVSGRGRSILLTALILFILAGASLVTWWTMPRYDNADANVQTVSSTPEQKVVERASQNQEMSSNDDLNPALSETASHQMTSNADEMSSSNTTSAVHQAAKPGTSSRKDLTLPPSSEEQQGPIGLAAGTKPLSEIYYMLHLPASLSWNSGMKAPDLEERPISLNLPIGKGLKDIYAPKSEVYAGASFMPSVTYYDPNPNNNGWSLGADIQYQSSRFIVYGGAGISHFRDKGTWQVTYNSYDSVGYYTNITSFTVDPDNSEKIIFETEDEAIFDTVPHLSITDRNNSYTYLDVPVGVGLTFLEKRRFSMTVKTGIRFSYLLAKDEPTADISMPGATDIGIIRKVPTRTTTTWRYTAGLEISYMLSERWNIYLEPAFEQYLNSVYVKDEEYSAKKPFIFGMNLGARVRIK